MPQFDILVVGAGLVGMSCALALSRQGMKVGLVEAKPESASPPSVSARDWDSRIYAISPTNTLLPSIAIVKLGYDKWLRFVFPLILIFLLLFMVTFFVRVM